MNTYKTVIYTPYEADDRIHLEQDAQHLTKGMIKNALFWLIEETVATDTNKLYFIIYRNNDPIAYGSFWTWIDSYVPSSLKGSLWIARWGKPAGEYERTMVLAE